MREKVVEGVNSWCLNIIPCEDYILLNAVFLLFDERILSPLALHFASLLCRPAIHPDSSIGDFSFALSLVKHHRCKYVTATCYDSEEVLHRKYPHAKQVLNELLNHIENHGSGEKRHLKPMKDESLLPAGTIEEPKDPGSSSSEWEGLSPCISSEGSYPEPTSIQVITNGASIGTLNTSAPGNISFHPSVSASNLSKCKPIRRKAPYNTIVFNFPHVGGLSTDVNRQVRANQELLVAFFKSCKPLLASKSNPVSPSRLRVWDDSNIGEECDDLSSDQVQEGAEATRATGQVIISLFEGEPYSLWNIRDLARHSGFKVVTSWRFPWEAYPGYRHARTLGEIVRRINSAGVVDGPNLGPKKKSAWKGEERAARGFVFEMIDGGQERPGPFTKERTRSKVQEVQRSNQKRKRRTSSSESDA